MISDIPICPKCNVRRVRTSGKGFSPTCPACRPLESIVSEGARLDGDDFDERLARVRRYIAQAHSGTMIQFESRTDCRARTPFD